MYSKQDILDAIQKTRRNAAEDTRPTDDETSYRIGAANVLKYIPKE